jgi:catechol 2,3-dioxygenase
MTDQQQQTRATAIHPATEVGALGLTVADLGRSLAFYTGPIGLRVLEQSGSSATLGVPGNPILMLREQPGVRSWPRGGRSYTGLYHFALLLPTRADLGRWLAHWLRSDMPMPGQGDHLVSEALYLEDPDGHGIEVYRDRPRDEWQWSDGRVRMASDPIDIRGLLQEAERSGEPWSGMPAGTKLGHIHLQVRDIPETARFYRDVLGFDIVAEMPTALFMSAGGYHHHIGANVWHSRGSGPVPDDSVNLRFFTVDLPDVAARTTVLARVEAAGIEVGRAGDAVTVNDPSGITIVLEAAGEDRKSLDGLLAEQARRG